jgi:hypothetical protein
MSRLSAMREMDADLHAALADAGLGNDGHYTAVDANFDVPVRCYLDRAVQVLGEFGQVVGRRDELVILSADVEAAAKARVFLPDEGITVMLGDKVSDDGSLSRWVVRRV